MNNLTHLDQSGAAHIVDISAKGSSERVAMAEGKISMSVEALRAIQAGSVKKGDVLAVARIAGIMAAKKTSDLIPLCHPLSLTSVSIDFTFENNVIVANSTTKTTGQTGVEMEALTAISAALLTIYDMAKAIDRTMVIGGIRLLAKSGGRSGDWTADA